MATTQRMNNMGNAVLFAGEQRIGTVQNINVTPSFEELPNSNGTIYPTYTTEAHDLTAEEMNTILSRATQQTTVLVEGSFGEVEWLKGSAIDKAFKSVKMGKPKPRTNREAVRFLEKE